MKASQMGFSEWCVNTALWFADTKGGNVLYTMPTQTQMDDFSKARIKSRIDASDYLSSLMASMDRSKGVDNVRLRKLRKAYLYFRGSDKPRQIIAIDADLLIRDEFDFMKPDNVAMMEKRLGASRWKWIRDVSTPTYPDFGIHKEFLTTDQRRYLLKCPHCNHYQELNFFENVKYKLDSTGEVKEAKVVCARCGKEIDRTAEGEWVPEFPSRNIHGYRINRLYSQVTGLKELIDNSRKTSEDKIQTFYNFDLGLPRAPKGGKLSRDIILACRDMEYEMPMSSQIPTTMGVDVGAVLMVRISVPTDFGRRAVFIGTMDTFEELGYLIDRYHVRSCCIDALPETRKAKELAKDYEGKVKLVYFSNQKELHKEKESEDGYAEIHCNRTQLIDEVVAQFQRAHNVLPRNVEEIEGYVNQVTAPVRVIEKDKSGRDIPRWIESGPDHFMFAEAYDYLACVCDFEKEGPAIAEGGPFG